MCRVSCSWGQILWCRSCSMTERSPGYGGRRKSFSTDWCLLSHQMLTWSCWWFASDDCGMWVTPTCQSLYWTRSRAGSISHLTGGMLWWSKKIVFYRKTHLTWALLLQTPFFTVLLSSFCWYNDATNWWAAVVEKRSNNFLCNDYDAIRLRRSSTSKW